MMNADTTLVPTGGPTTPGPSAATVPEISWPITAGVGNATSAFITCRSVWHTPQALTFTSTSPALGSGMGISSTRRPPGADSRIAAFMVCIRCPRRLKPKLYGDVVERTLQCARERQILFDVPAVSLGRGHHRNDRHHGHEHEVRRDCGASDALQQCSGDDG